MRVKMLRSIGRNLVDLVPDVEKGDKAVAAGLAARCVADLSLREGAVADVSQREADLLKRYGLAEDAPADEPAPGRRTR